MNRVFDPRKFAKTPQHIAKNTAKSTCGDCSQCVAARKEAECATDRNVWQSRSVAQSVVAKIQSTQWDGWLRHTATLLLLKKNISVYVHTHAHVHVASIGTVFEMLRPPGPVGGVGAFFRPFLGRFFLSVQS